VVLWQLNCGLTHVFGPLGNPVGVLVGAVLIELVTDVSEDGTEIVVLVVADEDIATELEVELAMQLQALLTRLATSPLQAATAKVGIELVAVTVAVVNEAQNA